VRILRICGRVVIIRPTSSLLDCFFLVSDRLPEREDIEGEWFGPKGEAARSTGKGIGGCGLRLVRWCVADIGVLDMSFAVTICGVCPLHTTCDICYYVDITIRSCPTHSI
jgi:hypothetical protein